jgi:hypothetical protein
MRAGAPLSSLRFIAVPYIAVPYEAGPFATKFPDPKGHIHTQPVVYRPLGLAGQGTKYCINLLHSQRGIARQAGRHPVQI